MRDVDVCEYAEKKRRGRRRRGDNNGEISVEEWEQADTDAQ